MRDFSRPGLWLAIWLFGWALCIALSLLPPVELGGPPDSDKLGHFLAYGTLSAWSTGLFQRIRGQALGALSLFVLGLTLELAQAALTTDRQGDLADVVANTLGVLAGLALAATPLATVLQRLDNRLFSDLRRSQ